MDAAAARPGSSSGWMFHQMVGRSPVMQQLFARIERLGVVSTTVLIVGETGTGKELAGRALHACGPRAGEPFVAVNCAALPRELIESELFGHARGAFSGAVSASIGVVRAAGGGTLLLDEITEMAPEAQAKLLRVLQERTVRPVGSTQEIAVDVRVVATTNRVPETAVAEGVLRQDLYYRMGAATLIVPPLRERRDDIPLLVEHWVATLNQRYQRTVGGVTADAVEWLRAQPWAGNVRELFNVVEGAFACRHGSLIALEDFETSPPIPFPSPERALGSPRTPTLREAERALISRALAATGGNKAQAARVLGVSRKTLYAKLSKYDALAPGPGDCHQLKRTGPR